ncbi:CopG family transcriptional regulator [Streptomyces atacamensis]|uniref:CopG family transcriptional regulator n=1 Tax=Streptomyces atacamensis TaxID=531966 RepID=UPI00399CB4C3
MRPADPPGTGPRTATRKITVTIPEDFLEEIRSETTERGMSAYFTEVLRLKRKRDRLRELVDWLEEEHGPVTEGEHTAALRELEDLDTEHDRRRTTARNHPGEDP